MLCRIGGMKAKFFITNFILYHFIFSLPWLFQKLQNYRILGLPNFINWSFLELGDIREFSFFFFPLFPGFFDLFLFTPHNEKKRRENEKKGCCLKPFDISIKMVVANPQSRCGR
jgi:hypothetical protein